MKKENEILSIEETLQILNTMAMEYYEMGLPQLSEQIWYVLYKKHYAYYQLHPKKQGILLPKRIFTLLHYPLKNQCEG